MFVCGGGRGSDVPLNKTGVSGGCCSYPHVACLRELEKASGGIYQVEGLYVRLLLCVVYDEEEGHIVSGQCVHAGDSFCSVVSFHISVDCRGYHLDYQNEEYHCNGIYRGIGYARYVAVRHGVGGSFVKSAASKDGANIYMSFLQTEIIS